jgi:hypothetical protein
VTVVVAMWSGPRNISTTMMRAFENRLDTTVYDEPFYGLYLANSGAVHPYRDETLEAYPTIFDEVLRSIEARATAPVLFLKHIAYHLPVGTDPSFLNGWKNFLLIRDPRAMVASYADRFDDVTPILRSYEVARAIADHLATRGLPCPVIDASDIQRAPEPALRTLCASLDLPFDARMLAWPSGPRQSDGPWGPHWYEAVRASTGFRPLVEKNLSLTPALERAAELAGDNYRALAAQRLAF